MSYQPRYLAYCRAHGLSPEDMIVADSKRYQGGRMTGFILWTGQHWSWFHSEFGTDPLRPPHEKFDRWLLKLYPERPLKKV